MKQQTIDNLLSDMEELIVHQSIHSSDPVFSELLSKIEKVRKLNDALHLRAVEVPA